MRRASSWKLPKSPVATGHQARRLEFGHFASSEPQLMAFLMDQCCHEELPGGGPGTSGICPGGTQDISRW
jgi:hypothetical protein